jgi:hypothetical protein
LLGNSNFWRRIIEIGAALRDIDALVNSNQARHAHFRISCKSAANNARAGQKNTLRKIVYANERANFGSVSIIWRGCRLIGRHYLSTALHFVFVCITTINCAPSLTEAAELLGILSAPGVLRVRERERKVVYMVRVLLQKKQVAASISRARCSWPFALASRALDELRRRNKTASHPHKWAQIIIAKV